MASKKGKLLFFPEMYYTLSVASHSDKQNILISKPLSFIQSDKKGSNVWLQYCYQQGEKHESVLMTKILYISDHTGYQVLGNQVFPKISIFLPNIDLKINK